MKEISEVTGKNDPNCILFFCINNQKMHIGENMTLFQVVMIVLEIPGNRSLQELTILIRWLSTWLF